MAAASPHESNILKILIVDAISVRADAVTLALSAAACDVVGVIEPSHDLVDAVSRLSPDVLIIDLDAPSSRLLNQVATISQLSPLPIVMFAHNQTGDSIQAAIRAGVSAYVVDGLEAGRIKAVIDVAVVRFQAYRALQAELEKTKANLENRKIVERAKGVLMQQRGCSEAQAHSLLQKLAMNRRAPLKEVAKNILSVAEVFADP